MAGKEVFNLAGATRKRPPGRVPPSPQQAWQRLGVGLRAPGAAFLVGAITSRNLGQVYDDDWAEGVRKCWSAVCTVTSAFQDKDSASSKPPNVRNVEA